MRSLLPDLFSGVAMNKKIKLFLTIFLLSVTFLFSQYQDYFYHWGEPENGLVLGLSLTDDVLGFHIMNQSDSEITVYSHVSAGQKHYDHYYLHVQYLFGEVHIIEFVDNRNRSAPVFIALEPYQILGNYVYLKDWCSKPRFNIRNGLAIIWLEYNYQIDHPGYDEWMGILYSDKVMTTMDY